MAAERPRIHARRIGDSRRHRYWLLLTYKNSDDIDDLGYARRIGFRQWEATRTKDGPVLFVERSLRRASRRLATERRV